MYISPSDGLLSSLPRDAGIIQAHASFDIYTGKKKREDVNVAEARGQAGIMI